MRCRKRMTPLFFHTRARVNKVEKTNPIMGPKTKRNSKGANRPLPTFRQDYRWPVPLDKILSFGKSDPQRDVLVPEALIVLGAQNDRYF